MVAELRAVYGSFHRTFFQPPPVMLFLSKTGYQQPWVYSASWPDLIHLIGKQETPLNELYAFRPSLPCPPVTWLTLSTLTPFAMDHFLSLNLYSSLLFVFSKLQGL